MILVTLVKEIISSVTLDGGFNQPWWWYVQANCW